MKPTIEINEANFEAEVLKSPQPVIVDFWAEWCGPCKMLAPVLDEIATEQSARAKVTKVNVDEHPALAARFGVQSIPTLLYFTDGKVRHQTVGVAGKRAIVAKLDELVVAATAGYRAASDENAGAKEVRNPSAEVPVEV